MVNGCYLMEPRRVPIRAARALISPTAGRAPAWLLNPGTEAITIHKGTKLTTLESVANLTISAINTQGWSDPPSDRADKAFPRKQAQLWQYEGVSVVPCTSPSAKIHGVLTSVSPMKRRTCSFFDGDLQHAVLVAPHRCCLCRPSRAWSIDRG